MTLTITDQRRIAKSVYGLFNTITQGSHEFPLNIFFGLQSFAVCQWFSDFVGGVVQYPLFIFQAPFGHLTNYPLAFPNRRSDFQAALNLTRYRNIHTDIV